MGYKKDIFAVFAYEFESLHKSRRKPCISSIPQELHIIKTKSCISSLRKQNTACAWWYTPSVRRCTLTRDDSPVLSQWIKNRQVETCRFLVRARGLEPPPNCSDMNLNHTRLPVPPCPHILFSSGGFPSERAILYSDKKDLSIGFLKLFCFFKKIYRRTPPCLQVTGCGNKIPGDYGAGLSKNNFNKTKHFAKILQTTVEYTEITKSRKRVQDIV